jgi:hypothetical protein
VTAEERSDEIDRDALSALRRLGRGRGGRVPYVQQLEAADCGAACLAMVLSYHGHVIRLDDARRLLRPGSQVRYLDRSGHPAWRRADPGDL